MYSSSKLVRPFVTWRNSGATDAQLVSFSECLLHLFQPNSCEVRVKLSQSADGVELSEDSDGVILAHPSSCPFLQLSEDEKRNFVDRRLSVASCLLAVSADGKVLLSRRSANLRAYPGVWVPPGGHTDPGETLEQSACREFCEETGLDVMESEIVSKAKLLGLWEGTYPTLRSLGLPKRHHLVAYYWLKLSHNSTELERFTLAPDEVDLVAWLPHSAVKEILNPSADANAQHGITAFKLASADGSVVKQIDLSIDQFLKELQPGEPDNNRVSSGTKFALQRLLSPNHLNFANNC